MAIVDAIYSCVKTMTAVTPLSRFSDLLQSAAMESKTVTADSLRDWRPDEALGAPGEFPFTRGIHPTMYRGRPWSMRQYAGFGTAAESNTRYRYLLDQGVSGLSVAFDLPTQIGYDSDHALAAGEVGRVGVAIDSIEDMAVLFDEIPLDKVSTSMTINATAIILLALYVAAARRQSVAPGSLAGTVQNDILKEYIARGTYIFPPRPSLRIVTDVVAYCGAEIPAWHPVSLSGYHIREAGATAAQEVAFTFADAIAYVEAAIAAGLDVNHFGRRLSFFFSADNDFLEEIAKFRAARRLWARLMRDRFGATEPKAQQLRFHTQTAGSTLTAQQPDSLFTATGGTKRAGSPPKRRPGSRSVHNNLSPARRASRTRSTRWPDRTQSNSSPTPSSGTRQRCWPRSMSRAAPLPPSSGAPSSARSKTRRTGPNRGSTRASGSWWV